MLVTRWSVPWRKRGREKERAGERGGGRHAMRWRVTWRLSCPWCSSASRSAPTSNTHTPTRVQSVSTNMDARERDVRVRQHEERGGVRSVSRSEEAANRLGAGRACSSNGECLERVVGMHAGRASPGLRSCWSVKGFCRHKKRVFSLGPCALWRVMITKGDPCVLVGMTRCETNF
eukprot:1779205-Rhodomonas_salina.5